MSGLARAAKGAARRLAGILPRRPRPAILMYHRIAHETFDPWGLAVQEAVFAEQLEWLAAYRDVMPLAAFAERQRDGRLPGTAISLTFDDGYACSLRTAAPLLARLGLPATIFLPAELIQRGGEFWWDELARVILEFEGGALRLGNEETPVPARDPSDHDWSPGAPPKTPRQRLFLALWSRLRTMRPIELDATMSEFRDQAVTQTTPRKAYRPLSPAEVRSARSPGITFGSHALTHPSLPALDESGKAREIGESRARCEALTGAIPSAFAYPYGDVDGASLRLVKDAGFDCACSTKGAFVGRRTDSFALPRLQVGNWDLRRFTDRLAGR